VVTNFSIKTEVFEGPLELLLDLVERRKLLINDISLASVTDEYMSAVSQMQEMSLPGTANFVALAATLLLIKSKSLLPVLELSEEEESSIEELEERLRLYQIYRVAAAGVTERFGVAVMHERQYVAEKKPLFLPDQFCQTRSLYEAMARVIKELPIKLQAPKVQIKKVISLEEMIDKLHQRIERQLKIRFSELVAETAEPHTLIVGFLAVLESVKQGSILVSQISRFEDIEIEYARPQLPRYR
jgi:segregation and condensation protein A